jgi:hypothetical protein
MSLLVILGSIQYQFLSVDYQSTILVCEYCTLQRILLNEQVMQYSCNTKGVLLLLFMEAMSMHALSEQGR